jgi:hypothetical protein
MFCLSRYPAASARLTAADAAMLDGELSRNPRQCLVAVIPRQGL